MGKKNVVPLDEVNPQDAAAYVVQALINKVQTDIGTMAANYQDGMLEFASNPVKQQRAQRKLATWYGILQKHASEIESVFDRARQEYRNLKKQLREAVTPVRMAQPVVR